MINKQTYSYNAANLVASASSKNSSVTYRYDLGGQQIGATWNDKRKTVNAYDAKGQLVSEQSTKTTTTGGGGTEIMSETDEPLVSGSIESMNVTGNSSDANRIIDRPFPTRPIITPPPYNTISPILPPRTKTITYYDNTYTYDSRGNRTSMTPASSGDAETYSYDLNNRLLNKAVGSVTTTYTYDSNGNMLSEKEGTKQAITYGYNAFNQLTSVSGADVSAEYSYLPNGLRCEKVVDGVTTMQVWDGDQLVAEATPGKLSVYIYGMGLVAQSVRSGVNSATTAVSYFMDDGMGNMLNTTNADGSLTSASNYMYDAFGNRVDEERGSPTFGYRGQYLDTETGNYYLRARYYDPALGRFTQQDSHWNVSNMVYGDSPANLLGQDIEPYAPRMGIISQAGNLYVYCINNPLMYADTSGHIITPANVIGAVIGAGGGAWLGTMVADYYGLSGWKRTLTIAGFTVGGAAVGWFAGPWVEKFAMTIAESLGIIASSSAAEKLQEMLGPDPGNRINHILKSWHAWDLVGANDWDSIAQIIYDTLNKCAEPIYNGVNYIYTHIYQGQTIEVRTFIKDGAERIVDAWVQTR